MLATVAVTIEIRTSAARLWVRMMRVLAMVVGFDRASRWAIAGVWRLARWRIAGGPWQRFSEQV